MRFLALLALIGLASALTPISFISVSTTASFPISEMYLSSLDQTSKKIGGATTVDMKDVNTLKLFNLHGKCAALRTYFTSGVYNNNISIWTNANGKLTSLATVTTPQRVTRTYLDREANYVLWSHDLGASSEFLGVYSTEGTWPKVKDSPISYLVTKESMYVSATKSMYSFLYDMNAPVNNRSYVVYSYDISANREYKSQLIMPFGMSLGDFSAYATAPDGANGPNGNLGYFVMDTGSFHVAGFSCTADRASCRISLLFTLDAAPQTYLRHQDVVYDPDTKELYVVLRQRAAQDKWEVRVYNVDSQKEVRTFNAPVKGGSLYSMVVCSGWRVGTSALALLATLIAWISL